MKTPSLTSRVARHARLSLQAKSLPAPETPPFLILFINSICNLTCEHCFYWRNLNRKDDLTFDEMRALSNDLGNIENLNLSGGEPFIREDFAAIVRLFISKNKVKCVYVPTNGYYTQKTVNAVREVLKEEELTLFACELSLDGTAEYHNRFRGNNRSFEKAMETYDALAELQAEDPRIRIHSISTATNENIEEIRNLTRYLYDRCPAMDHHNLALIRGDRKNEGLQGPVIDAYDDLWRFTHNLWKPREKGRFGSIVDPMLHWTKLKTAREMRQVAPCKAGIMSGVVYSNGDVSLCETHEPIGNLRNASFREIWQSPAAQDLRRDIAAGKCWCTNEIFMWPSMTYDPRSLTHAICASGAWREAF